MEQKSIKIKALNPIIISKVSHIIEDISKFTDVSSIEFNHKDSYSFIFTMTTNGDCDVVELIVKIKGLLKFHASAILAIDK